MQKPFFSQSKLRTDMGQTTESLYANPRQWIEAAVVEDRDRVAAAFASLTEREPAVSIEYRILSRMAPSAGCRTVAFRFRDAARHLIRLTALPKTSRERKRRRPQTQALHS